MANVGARGQGDWCAPGLVAVIGPMEKHCEDHMRDSTLRYGSKRSSCFDETLATVLGGLG